VPVSGHTSAATIMSLDIRPPHCSVARKPGSRKGHEGQSLFSGFSFLSNAKRRAKLLRLHAFSATPELGSMNEDINTLRRILRDTKIIAMVGLSANWWRPSFFAAKYLQERGYRVVPVNPQYPEILGEKSYPSLRDIPFKVDVVDCFRKSAEIPALAEEAIAIGAKVLWLQLGVINQEAAARAQAAGLEVVMDRCMKIEHGRLFGGLNWCGVNTKVISAKRPQYLPY
jgi:predicted CoA-binding protein